MISYFEDASYSYKLGSSEDDNITINKSLLTTVNTAQGGYDVITDFVAEATTFILGNGVLNIFSGGNNTIALSNSESVTVNLGNSHDTNLFGTLQNGGVAHIYGANLSTVRLALSADKSYSGTWSGENLNTLDLAIRNDTDVEIAMVHFYGVSDYNIPQLIGSGYICDRPESAHSEPEEVPGLEPAGQCSPAESAHSEPEETPNLCDEPNECISVLEKTPTLDEVIAPSDSGGSGNSTFPSWLEPIENGTGSVIVKPSPITDTPKVNPTSTM